MKIAIEARNLVRRFGPFTAVDGVSFAGRPGEIFGCRTASKSIFVKEVGLEQLWNQLSPLAVFGVVAVGAASRRFRKVQK